MKQITAIVKPFLAEKVLESLRLAPLEALQVREVKGFGRQKNSLDRYGDSEFSMAFLPKVEISQPRGYYDKPLQISLNCAHHEDQ